MMQKISTILSIILSFLLVALVHFGWLYYHDESDPASRRVEIRVRPGATLNEVQSMLTDEGVLGRPEVFRWAAFMLGKEKKIHAGRYLFVQGESVSSILNKLAGGEVDYTRVVIPEGLMIKEIAGILQERIEIDSTGFMELTEDAALMTELGIQAPSMEGYLFPDTYLFSWPLTPRGVVERMVHRYYEIFDERVLELADSLGLTRHEVVTLASIIQAEAVFNSEMPRISAVYHNRLNRGWRLEADPTVAYALGGVRRRLWYKDLRIDSPYNTYRVRGLPPGPICSPGRAAIMAAVLPLAGCEDLYFIADGSGRHVFNKTLREHLIDKERIRDGGAPWADALEKGTDDSGKEEDGVKEMIAE